MRKTEKKNNQRKLPFPSLRIDCYGKSTHVYLDGMEITPGVLELNFKAGSITDESPVLELKLHPHAVALKRVKKGRIETTNSTDHHPP